MRITFVSLYFYFLFILRNPTLKEAKFIHFHNNQQTGCAGVFAAFTGIGRAQICLLSKFNELNKIADHQ